VEVSFFLFTGGEFPGLLSFPGDDAGLLHNVYI